MQNAMEENRPATAEAVTCSVLNSLDEILYEVLLDDPPRLHCLNGAVETLTGYSADEIAAHSPDWEQIVHLDDRARYAESLKRCCQAGQAHKLQYRICARDGYIRCADRHPVTDASET